MDTVASQIITLKGIFVLAQVCEQTQIIILSLREACLRTRHIPYGSIMRLLHV
jgi:hypothetical protein